MVDQSGQSSWQAQTTAYGRIRLEQGTRAECPFRFQGQYEDVETGLYYNRFRYYDPQEGAYISQDPIRLLGGISSYDYVQNPTTYVDLLGLTGCEGITEEIHAFGNASGPKGIRPNHDIPVDENGIMKSQMGVQWPEGRSTTLNPKDAGLSGHYHTLPKGTKLPEGLDMIRDGKEVGGPRGKGHVTIFPSRDMTVDEFDTLFKSLPWQKGGKI